MFIFFQTFYHISLHVSVTRRETSYIKRLILCKSGSLYSHTMSAKYRIYALKDFFKDIFNDVTRTVLSRCTLNYKMKILSLSFCAKM